MGDSIFIRIVPLPHCIRAVTIPNDDVTFDIYVNESLPDEWREKALQHELNHIRMDHFYKSGPVARKEKEAG